MGKYKVLKILPLNFLNSLNINGIGSKKDIVDGLTFMYFPQKMKTFMKNCKCVACGIEANEVHIEYMKNCSHKVYSKPHVNVYAVLGNYSVLMTVDHNKLASQGGSDLDSNFSTMCSKCNNKRGSKYESVDDFLKSIEGRNLLQEYIENANKPKNPKNKAEKAAQQFFWENGHHWHYREYLRHLKAIEKAKKVDA